jgi:predicted phosphodiesterase
MKILLLSDLHLGSKCFSSDFYRDKQKRIFKSCFKQSLNDCDLVVISGDIVESNVMSIDGVNPLDTLYKLFEKDIVFCLGNHEFAYQRHADVLNWWSKFKHPNVHCLDIDGVFRTGKYNFVGNVLWYDWSLNGCRQLMQGEIIDGWLDSTIEDFDALEENKKCVEQIKQHLCYDKNVNNILVTHMVPHIDLNTFSREQPFSPYNAYSGMKRFVLDIQDTGANLTHAFCGHTHRRECKEIWGINCINLGNDYHFKSGNISYMFLEI